MARLTRLPARKFTEGGVRWGQLISSRSSSLKVKYEDCFFGNLNLIENPIRADTTSPYVIFTLHLLNIAEEWAHRQKMNDVKNNLGVVPRHFL